MSARAKRGVDLESLRARALALPGVEEGTCYGTMAFRVRGKFLARLKEDGESLVIKVRFEERDELMRNDPETFYITDHYKDWPSVLVRLPNVKPDDLDMLLEDAWRRAAPKRLLEAFQPVKRRVRRR